MRQPATAPPIQPPEPTAANPAPIADLPLAWVLQFQFSMRAPASWLCLSAIACGPAAVRPASAPHRLGETCATDSDCNGGDLESATVCGAGGSCIAGCHADGDCSSGEVCQGAWPDGFCGAPANPPACLSDTDCNGGVSGSESICGAGGSCIQGCHQDADCADSSNVCQNAQPDGVCGVAQAVVSTIAVPATQGGFAVSATVQISGSGSSLIGSIDIASNVGTLTLQGAALPAVAYEVQQFDGYTLYQLLAVDSARLVVAWVYCENGAVTDIYRESTDGLAVDYEAGSGTCGDDGTPTTVQVSLPATSFALPALVPGVVIQGSDLQYDGQNPGTANIAGTAWTFLPFNTVACETCGTPGWYELHSLLVDPASGTTCFSIFYLVDGNPDQVHLGYTLCLPTLTSMNAVLQGTWAHP